MYYSRHTVHALDTYEQAIAFLTSDPRAIIVLPLSDFERIAARLHGVAVIANAEEFDVRIERVLEQRKAAGREWVLLGHGALSTSTSKPLVN